MKKILKRRLLVLLALCTGYTVVASALLRAGVNGPAKR